MVSTRSKTGATPAHSPHKTISKKRNAKPASSPRHAALALFPDVSLHSDSGALVSTHSLLSDAAPGLIFFTYPRANTGGCTTQAKGLSALRDPALAAGYTIVGCSYDSVKSQAAWKLKSSIPLMLLSDTPSSGLLRTLSVHKPPRGVKRSVFVITRHADKFHIVFAKRAVSPKDCIALMDQYIKDNPLKPSAANSKPDHPMTDSPKPESESKEPAAAKPVAAAPAAAKPVADKPAAAKPAAATPAADKPAADKTTADKLAADKPAADKPTEPAADAMTDVGEKPRLEQPVEQPQKPDHPLHVTHTAKHSNAGESAPNAEAPTEQTPKKPATLQPAPAEKPVDDDKSAQAAKPSQDANANKPPAQAKPIPDPKPTEHNPSAKDQKDKPEDKSKTDLAETPAAMDLEKPKEELKA